MKNRSNLLWSISLLVIGIATILLAGSNVIGMELPNMVVRIIGVIDLIALPILVYTTVKKLSYESKLGITLKKMSFLRN